MNSINEASSCVDTLADALDNLEHQIFEMSKSDLDKDPKEILQVATNLHAVKSRIGALYSDIQAVITDEYDYFATPIAVDGATVEIKAGSARKKWDHASISDDVARRIVNTSVNIDTGEITKTPLEMLQEFTQYMGVSYWKVGKLKELHLDADEYCEVSPPKKNIVIRRSE
jgi:hypothetical protein